MYDSSNSMTYDSAGGYWYDTYDIEYNEDGSYLIMLDNTTMTMNGTFTTDVTTFGKFQEILVPDWLVASHVT